MPAARFGASKFRNAVRHIPPREEWYRGALPPAISSSSISSSTSTFSSEVKTNREWVVTLSPAGELSYRGYEALAGQEKVGVVKGLGGGGGVGDWDLSKLEDGSIAVGGLDGSISIYRLPHLSPEPAQPTLIHTIPSTPSPITNLSLHPTTPDILLASTVANPVAIYDLSTSATSPVLELNTIEPKGMWSVAWSPDGKLIAGVGKSGTGYVWDARAGKDAVISKMLSLQPSKPARIAFVGDDYIFLTSFSKTRNREYSLLRTASTLATCFAQSLDTSSGPLLPVVDQERRIIYTAGRGDMTLRQIELSGPMGFQETLHPLPHALTSSSLALAHPASLPVMSAQIATVVMPVSDKDGDVLLPSGIRVPRRHLIDYHHDLYPEVAGTVPEQTSKHWLAGGDAMPLPVSLDPARRGAWESALIRSSERPDSNRTAEGADSSKTTSTGVAKGVDTVSGTTAAETMQSGSEATEAKSQTAATDSASKPSIDDLPPLKNGETHASTSYKVRIMGHHIGEQLEEHRKLGGEGPLMIGLQGPQGCGKTTLCETLVEYLGEEPRNLRAAVLSLDDLYKTNAGLKELARRHPDNQLLSGRGPPGTHDVDLAMSVLNAVLAINNGPKSTVDLPIFEKSLCDGEGDRSSETIKLEGPIDVFILEGWSVGFGSLSADDLTKRYNEAAGSNQKRYFSEQSLESLSTINDHLSDFAMKVYPLISTVVQIEPTTYEYVFRWRLQQEHVMKAKNGGKGMTDEQVHAFVERYMPGYELWKEGIWADGAPWAGKGLRVFFGEEREVLRVVKPTASIETNGDSADNTARTSTAAPSGLSSASLPTSTTPSPLTPTKSLNTVDTQNSASITPATPSKPFDPSYSRKFLGGKSPLNPTYDQVPSLATLHQDSIILRCTSHLVFFPMQGPGGRLGVHPLNKKGRMPVGGEGYLSGGVELADFAVELFEVDRGVRVALAGEDGVVRVWRVGEEGVQGGGPEPGLVLKGKGIDKIAQLVFHPTAKDLLTAATNDHGIAHIRFWDLPSGQEVSPVELDTSGVFNIAWSPNGDRLAVATKDGHILVLDPRNPSTMVSGKAHDSPRSFQMAWIDNTHLISVGFSRGSQRKIKLYAIASSEITTVHSLTIDVSPSVLFPVFDPDTSILYVWGKGERQIQAYEVHPETATEPIAQLPSYTSGSPQLGVAFLPKRVLDVRKVEVMRVLRLTARTMEDVTFSIPRNKPDFFQDDIYVDTIDVETPVTTAAEWLKGNDTPPKRISFRPEEMTPLSQAPQTTSTAKAKFVPATDVMSEEEKKRREMDRLFLKARADESSDEEILKTGIDPPDDDW